MLYSDSKAEVVSKVDLYISFIALIVTNNKGVHGYVVTKLNRDANLYPHNARYNGISSKQKNC